MNRDELKCELNKLGVDERSYSLDGDIRDYAHNIYQNYNKWEVFYQERSEHMYDKIFFSEDSACDFLYEIIKNDPSTRIVENK